MLIGSCALTVTLRRVPLNEANRAPKARGVLAMVHSCSMQLRFLVSCCVDDRCDMMGSDEDRDRSRRHVAKNWRCSHGSGTRWSDDQKVR
jgi:hypothetical protein